MHTPEPYKSYPCTPLFLRQTIKIPYPLIALRPLTAEPLLALLGREGNEGERSQVELHLLWVTIQHCHCRMALRLWASSAANALKISGTGARAAAPAFSISRFFATVHDGLKYTPSHEWVKHHDGGVVTVGITDHAQGHLGEVVFVELPEPGTQVSAGGSFGNVESVKATSDVNSPISGEVVEVNSKLTEKPGLINTSPYEDGWMIKVKPSSPAEADGLLDAAKYTKHCEEEDAH